MVELSPLERYRNYVVVLDGYAPHMSEEEYVELLGTSETIDLLCARDELSELDLDAEDQRELQCLDDLLVKHSRAIVASIPQFPDEPRSHWWWHLHEGPQVRDEALAAATDVSVSRAS